jgi:hypothetical protein
MIRILPSLMFLLIYSPKIAGRIDSMSMFAFLVFLFVIINNKSLQFPRILTQHTMGYLVFGIVMLFYVVIHKSINGLQDTYQVLRFGRVIINVLGIYSLIVLYYTNYKNNFNHILLYHLWLCIIFHAVIMILMFLFPIFNQFVLTYLIQLEEDHKSFETRILGQRIGGLTGTWDAASGIQSLGIILIPFILKNFGVSKMKRFLIKITIPISLAAIFLSGVTGLVNIILVSVLLFTFHFRYLKRAFFKTVIFLLFFVPISWYILGEIGKSDAPFITNSSIGRTIFMLTQNDEIYEKSTRSTTASETVDKILSNMYFLPEDQQTLFFGKGGSGRGPDYIIEADPGITLNLHNLGIFFVIFIYSFCLFMIIKALKIGKVDLYLSLGVAAVLLTIMIIDAKVMYLLARQSLSIMLIAYYIVLGTISSKQKLRRNHLQVTS